MSLNDALHWRYSPKRMTGAKVSEDNINSILKAAQYAPTSMGLQPFTLFLISSQSLLKDIRPIAYNQPQVTEASHLLLFAAYTHLSHEHIDDYLNTIMETRAVSAESLDAFKASMNRFAQQHTKEQIIQWAANQTYIALGFAVAEAALIGVDATPMEGFDNTLLDQLLQLKEHNLTSVALLAIGYRDVENDFLANEKKVRRSLDKLVVRLS
ncbi:MAG: nitroreductase family protein [Bacteroidota bacterium]